MVFARASSVAVTPVKDVRYLSRLIISKLCSFRLLIGILQFTFLNTLLRKVKNGVVTLYFWDEVWLLSQNYSFFDE